MFGPSMVIGGCVGVIVQHFRSRNDAVKNVAKDAGAGSTPERFFHWTPWLGVVFIVLYALLLNLEFVDFRVASSLFLLAIGLLLSKWQMKYLPAVVCLALTVSFSIHLLFERLFVVELP